MLIVRNYGTCKMPGGSLSTATGSSLLLELSGENSAWGTATPDLEISPNEN